MKYLNSIIVCFVILSLGTVQSFKLQQSLPMELKEATDTVPRYVTPPVIEAWTACNYQTDASTFYHLNDIVKKDGGGEE